MYHVLYRQTHRGENFSFSSSMNTSFFFFVHCNRSATNEFSSVYLSRVSSLVWATAERRTSTTHTHRHTHRLVSRSAAEMPCLSSPSAPCLSSCTTFTHLPPSLHPFPPEKPAPAHAMALFQNIIVDLNGPRVVCPLLTQALVYLK